MTRSSGLAVAAVTDVKWRIRSRDVAVADVKWRIRSRDVAVADVKWRIRSRDVAVADAGRRVAQPRYRRGRARDAQREPRPAMYTAIIVKLSGVATDHRFIDSAVLRFIWQGLAAHLDAAWDHPTLQADVARLRAEAEHDRLSGRADAITIPQDDAGARDAVVRLVQQRLQEGRKTPAVQALCGGLLTAGFERGDLQSETYADVRPAFRRWHELGLRVGVYDSFPVATSEAWLRQCKSGDLMPFVHHVAQVDDVPQTFGTATSPQVDEAFAAMARTLGEPAMLATDRTFEALAAARSGLTAVIMERGGVFGSAPHGLRIETNLLALVAAPPRGTPTHTH